MNEKGSIKDRLKSWWIFLIKKRRKMEKEKQEKQRLSLWFYVKKTILVTGCFLGGMFITRKEKNAGNRFVALDEKKQETQKLKNEVKKEEDLEKLNNYKLKIDMEEVELIDLAKKIDLQTEKKNKEILNQCQTNLKEAKETVQEKMERFENKLEENEIKKKLETTKQKKKEDMEKETVIQHQELKKEKITPSFDMALEKTKKEEMKNISSKKDSKEKIKPKKKEVLPVLPMIIPILTANYLRKKDLDKLEKTMEEKNKKVEKTKIKETKEKNAKEKTIKSEIKEQKKVKIDRLELKDLLVMSKLIDENIKQNKIKIQKLKKEMMEIKPILKKKSFLFKLRTFMLGSIKTVLSLVPLKLFKNKTLGVLTSAVLVNNSIRSMRNTLRKEEYYLDYIAFENIHNKLTSTLSDMDKIEYVCKDSLEQISSFKQELNQKYEMDENLVSVFNELKILEDDVHLKLEEVKRAKNSLEEQKNMSKQKVLEKKIKDKVA